MINRLPGLGWRSLSMYSLADPGDWCARVTPPDMLETTGCTEGSSRAVQVLKQPDAAGTLEIRGCALLSRNLDWISVLWIIHNQPYKLHGLGLTGNLGVELSHLKSLKHLDLSANNIEGSFPLQNLADNKLGQSITYSFERMQHLRHLNLGHNSLTGPLDDVLNGLQNLKLMGASDLIRIFDKPHRLRLITSSAAAEHVVSDATFSFKG
ncbi:hypothetical protein OROMI_019040 [Orobanche minor]